MQIRRCPRQRATLVRPAGMLCKVGDLSPTETAFRLQHGRNAATGCTDANVCSSGSNSRRGQPPSCQPLPGAECPISAHPGPKAVRKQTTRSGYLSSCRHTSRNVCIRAIANRPGTTEMGAIPPRPWAKFPIRPPSDTLTTHAGHPTSRSASTAPRS